MLHVTKFFTELSNYIADGSIEVNVLQSLNQMKSEITNRIHNSEKGGKDKDGVGFGGYTSPWARQRKLAGHQILKKDFEFSGDLRRSPKIVSDGNIAKITLDESTSIRKGKVLSNRDKALYLTKQHGRGDVIWKASEKEIKGFYLTLDKLIDHDIKKIHESI